MGTDGSELVETLPNPRSFKVHRTMCAELRKLVDRILRIIPQIEAARPSGMQALCLLNEAIDKAKQLLLYCSESSKLYLAITGDSILSKFQKARKSLTQSLVQILNMVPVMLAAEISRLIGDFECVTFVLNSAEQAAGKVMKQLLQQDPSTSDKDSMEESELKDFQFVAARLGITSPTAILIERRSIQKLLEKLKPNDQTKEIILKNLLFLLIKHRKSITGEQMEVYSQSEGPITTQNSDHESQKNLHVKSYLYLNHGQYRTHASELSRLTPPEEYTCPISLRLMYDPVVIASGKTYERMWIQKWFDEGNTICPKTKKELAHMALTPNVALKDLILNWCKTNGVSIPDPRRHVQDFHSWEASSNSIRSFGSSLYDLNFPMDFSNMSLGSLDTSYNSDSSHTKANHSLNLMLNKSSDNSRRHQSHVRIHDADRMHLSKLHERQWESQCQVIENMKIDFKCNYQAFCSVSSESFIDPLTRFLSTACERHDVKALRAGTKLLMEFMKCCRNGMTNLSEDTCIMLASLLDTEAIGEALTIMEELTGNWYEKANIAASSVLTSVSKILDSGNEEFQRKAIKIMYNFSSNGQICPYMVSLGCIPKLLPFFEDRTLLRDSIHILKNLCDTEEGRVTVVETKGCISSVVEILGTGSDEEKEPALIILLSLCSQRVEYCQLVVSEGIIPSLVNISNKGSDMAKAYALELLRLLKDDEFQYEDCCEPNLGASQEPNNHYQEKKSSKKPSILKKLSLFSKSSSVAPKTKR
ncbi:U-box domain-containing protein 5 [Glycine max]|uniref:RING-type E3 ubiquitin transferase n=1 Tax=Glycine soja TaxID=3848 RepID=A0A445GIC5_GLYSO|nr:U-box domain-containing protein 5-like isoform X1 [Glycine soja]XP_028207009.1 U-box domain-containing protein 5-like isoform X1 [Glycine soja]XP_028207010.1 U-box domain-containing protein 5-like isoform X1 [Glycine soja]XP_028207011.1 U-box domain-containing protein 5-like isoform X1 [Glycine soja]KAH1206445.1 U-box domain-containing protein 5 [Glycine max]KAH1206447.1 U-box domain-containing protein 5 [Glycine max]RZB60975.1 U-box domain-containing protein 5 isoform A [Glycine soja]RZB